MSRKFGSGRNCRSHGFHLRAMPARHRQLRFSFLRIIRVENFVLQWSWVLPEFRHILTVSAAQSVQPCDSDGIALTPEVTDVALALLNFLSKCPLSIPARPPLAGG